MAKRRKSPEERAWDHTLAEGTLGCTWRWSMIIGHVIQTHKDALVDEKMDYDHLAGLKAIREVTEGVPVIEVPALAYAEAHGHCLEIATRVFLERHLVFDSTKEKSEVEMARQFDEWVKHPDVAPTVKYRQVYQGLSEEMQRVLNDRWSTYRQTRKWTYEGEPRVFLYSKPIAHVGVNDDSIAHIYDLPDRSQFDWYLVGHSISCAGLVAFTLQVSKDRRDGIGISPQVEYMTIANMPSQWFHFESYADDVLRRLCTYRAAGEPLNSKLSFKRKLQKMSSAMGGKARRFPVEYRQMHSVGIDLFPEIAIRRGWVHKDEDAAKAELDERIAAGTHSVKTWTDGDKVQVNVNHGHKAIVERFLATRAHQEALEHQAPDEEFRQHGREVGALLRQARIIELPWRYYWKQLEKSAVAMHNATLIALGRERYQSEDWATLTERMRQLKKDHPEDHDQCSIRVHNAMVKLTWEPELPFPVCWLGYDIPIGGDISKWDGSKMDFIASVYNLGTNVDPRVDGSPYLYGHLLTKDTVYAFFTLIKKGHNGEFQPTHKCFALVEKEVDWNFPNAYSGMVLMQTMAFIADHAIVIEQPSRKSQARLRKKIGRIGGKKVEPPPFYTVYIRDGVYDVKKQPVREGVRGPLTYSHDRSGGTYYKIKRGPLPLSNRDRAALLRPRTEGHGYQIFEDTMPWGEWAEAVKKRGARPKRHDEWMAILKWRRRETIVRPDLPKYIPSVRRSEKHKEKKRGGRQDP